MENGKIAIAKNLCNGIGCGTTELHVFRPVVKDTNSFLFYFLLQKEIREMAKNRFQGTSGHLRVPVDFFEEIWFPLSPFEEQHEIVRRVEALFKIADQIEERYKKAKAYIDKLTQSILAKAFRGELVPQDPNDEPASELLKRIQEKKDRQTKKREEKVKK
jgi:type I restriction enzyme S subunit